MRFLRVLAERGVRCAKVLQDACELAASENLHGIDIPGSRDHLDFLPRYVTLRGLPRARPRPEGLIHSAASWRLGRMGAMYVPRRDYPTDADLWMHVAVELRAKGLESLYVPKITVVKESEHRLLEKCASR